MSAASRGVFVHSVNEAPARQARSSSARALWHCPEETPELELARPRALAPLPADSPQGAQRGHTVQVEVFGQRRQTRASDIAATARIGYFLKGATGALIVHHLTWRLHLPYLACSSHCLITWTTSARCCSQELDIRNEALRPAVEESGSVLAVPCSRWLWMWPLVKGSA